MSFRPLPWVAIMTKLLHLENNNITVESPIEVTSALPKIKASMV